jgi:uncharacterized protein involved in exopolysaccharide biosynthesis
MEARADEARPVRAAEENPARELVNILARGKWTVLLVFLIVTGVVAYGALRARPLFKAESSLMVRIGREYVYRPEVGRSETGGRMPSLSEMVNSEVEILSSRDLAEAVVRELGVERLFPKLLELDPDRELAISRGVGLFRAASSVRPVLESSVIKVGFEHEVPELAAEAVNRLLEHFKDKHIEVFSEERTPRLEEQLVLRLEQLAQAELALAEFKRTNGVFDLGQQRVLLLDRRERLDTGLQLAEGELAELRLRAGPDSQSEPTEPTDLPALPAHLRPEMKDELLRQRYDLELALRGIEPPVSDRLVESAAMKLLDLELEESQLLRDFAPTNRKVRSVQAEIQYVRGFLEQAEKSAGVHDQAREAERTARTQEMQDQIRHLTEEIELLVREEERLDRLEARQSIQVLEIKRNDLLARLEVVDREVRALDQQEQPLRRLERELEAAQAATQIYRDRLEDARITEELDREKQISVRVIEKASRPVSPTGLPRNLVLAIGAFVGLIAGVGVAVLLDLFRARA